MYPTPGHPSAFQIWKVNQRLFKQSSKSLHLRSKPSLDPMLLSQSKSEARRMGKNENLSKKVDEALKHDDIKKKIDAVLTRAAASNTEMVEQALGSMVLLKGKREPTDQPIDQSSVTSDIAPVDRSIKRLNTSFENSPSSLRPYLRDSRIFDTGAERHMRNNRSTFLTFELAEEQAYTGDSTTRVEGYGTVWTYIINVGKQFKVILRNAA
ncbi:hypothetical protein I7I51_06516 [Histoplasma capsulatum]|uniref:Uncharacterized protein n=1 Tax=Ajellomyces capsulatus TaxID=5037 RepID=A0A8A1MGD8_AJECA|nr:hypothetical protein I7I51_06516 [Histoplasma capsulatum]